MAHRHTANAATRAAADRLRDHIAALDGPQLLAEARCLAGSADDLDRIGMDPAVSVVFRTLGALTSRLDASTVHPVEGAIVAADSCTCHNGTSPSTRELMRALVDAGYAQEAAAARAGLN